MVATELQEQKGKELSGKGLLLVTRTKNKVIQLFGYNTSDPRRTQALFQSNWAYGLQMNLKILKVLQHSLLKKI